MRIQIKTRSIVWDHFHRCSSSLNLTINSSIFAISILLQYLWFLRFLFYIHRDLCWLWKQKRLLEISFVVNNSGSNNNQRKDLFSLCLLTSGLYGIKQYTLRDLRCWDANRPWILNFAISLQIRSYFHKEWHWESQIWE